MKNKKPIGIFITDTHYKSDNIEEVNSVLFQAVDLAKELGVPLFHGGDWFTDRVGRTLKELNAMFDFLSYASSLSVQIFTIPGNHDKTDLNDEKSYLDIFSNFWNFTVVKSIRKFSLSNKVSITLIPYFKDNYNEYLETALSRIKSKDINVLLTHTAIDGVKNNDGSQVSNIRKTTKFRGFDLVLVGHYHNFQSFENIVYFGSARPENFGEDNNKGVLVLYNDGDFDRKALDFIKYETIKIDLSKVNKPIVKIRSLLKVWDVETLKKTKVRVVLNGVTTKHRDWYMNEFRPRLKGFRVDFKQLPSHKVADTEIKDSDLPTLDQNTSFSEKLEKFLTDNPNFPPSVYDELIKYL